MATPKSLPVRPSLESLRKRAKQLARAAAAGDPAAVARVRVELPHAVLPLNHRDAQLVIAREYGFQGWRDLRAEVMRRSGHGLDWAAEQARAALRDDDAARLRTLVSEYPALISFRDAGGTTLLARATSSFGDSAEPERERRFTRAACAELLVDAGALVDENVWRDLIRARAKGLLQVLDRKGVLPRALPVLVALGDVEAVRARLQADEQAAAASRIPGDSLTEAFVLACRFEHLELAELVLQHCIDHDDELGRRVDGGPGRRPVIQLIAQYGAWTGADAWQTFVAGQLARAIDHDDLASFERCLQSEPWLLCASHEAIQVEVIERCVYMSRQALLERFFAFEPALLQRQPAQPASAIEYAFEYGNVQLIPLLRRVWPVPDDLAHAAGTGDLARVQRWFDDAGEPALGDLTQHYPTNNPRKLSHLDWRAHDGQHILDTALAWACLNCHFDVAEFLLEHGADIDTRWGTHEPASILHECALQGRYDSARFLIQHDIDTTILDERWRATAEGWARHAAHDDAFGEFIAKEQRAHRRARGLDQQPNG